MSNLYNLYSSDETLAENGKWFEFGEEVSVKIRRYKSKKSRKVRENLEAPYKRASKFATTLPDDVLESITNRHVAEGIIADWKGVSNRDGQPVAYSPAAALALINDLPDFRDAVVEISLSLDNFREEVKQDVEGN